MPDAGIPTVYAHVIDAPLDEAAVRAAVEHPESGAVLVFHGVVRNHDQGRGVRQLEYQAHPEAERLLAECVAAEQERTGVRLAAAHRFGTLGIGDVALAAAAASPHRAAAFGALEALIHRIKTEVPIWKRQSFDDGLSEWVGM
ncbi:molybdenum cofactor biosynthesis protein MoaE [Leucobacter sp. W1153]|uniref:molybdenum cofactor biosynthesis protein MoaE n=1 Tax=Leucobacter sp. W1153 TaxID=3439064 RepID=UPI003F3575D6